MFVCDLLDKIDWPTDPKVPTKSTQTRTGKRHGRLVPPDAAASPNAGGERADDFDGGEGGRVVIVSVEHASGGAVPGHPALGRGGGGGDGCCCGGVTCVELGGGRGVGVK